MAALSVVYKHIREMVAQSVVYKSTPSNSYTAQAPQDSGDSWMSIVWAGTSKCISAYYKANLPANCTDGLVRERMQTLPRIGRLLFRSLGRCANITIQIWVIQYSVSCYRSN